MKNKVVYAVVALLTGLSYLSVRHVIIAQGPTDTHIVVSSLTLNYVLFALLVGALVPTITRKLFPKRFKTMLAPVAVTAGVLLVLTLRALGVEMRF